MTTLLPSEQTDAASRQIVRVYEQSVVRWLLYCLPLIFFIVWVISAIYGRTFLFFLPARPAAEFFRSRLGLAAAAATSMCPVIWFLALRLTPRSRTVESYSAVVLTAVLVSLSGVFLATPQVQTVICNLVLLRSPHLDFARNIAWTKLLLLQVPQTERTLRIGLVGSSQINLAVDEKRLSEQVQGSDVRKFCLPGMVPLQYAGLIEDLERQKLDVIVCWLSEFDFFRETGLPVDRLRWCGTRKSNIRFARLLGPKLCWENRAGFADLTSAAGSTCWRDREILQMLIFRFWWHSDPRFVIATPEELKVGARLADREQGLQNLRENVMRTPLLEANFDAFRMFASSCIAAGSTLIVVQGECEPDAMRVYDPSFRDETHSRLRQMSGELQFVYSDAKSRVDLSSSDWADSLHLNSDGRQKFTLWLSDEIAHLVSE